MRGKLLFLALGFLLSASVVGCGLAPAAVDEGPDVPATTVSAQPPQEATASPEPTPADQASGMPEASATPEGEAPPTQDTPASSRIEVPEAGLTFELPEPWVRLEPDWVWAPEVGSDIQVGVTWAALEPPQEVEAVMLPGPSEILSSEPIELVLGTGRRFLINVFGPANEGSGEQAPVASVQTHMLVVLDLGGTRLAYDFFAKGADAEQLARAESVLEQLVASVSTALVVEGEGEPATGMPVMGVPEAAAKAIAILARHLDVAESAIELVDWEPVDWSDACLGIHKAGTLCAQVITPGYRVTLTVGDRTYELHTNQNGTSVGIVP